MGRRWEGEVVEEGGLDPFGCGTLPRASSLWVYHQKTVGLRASSGTSTGQSFPSRAITQSWWRELHVGRKASGVQETEANAQVAPGEGEGVQRPAFVGKMWHWVEKAQWEVQIAMFIGSILHIGHSVYGGVDGFPWRSAVPRLYCYREAHPTSATAPNPH